MPMSLTKKEEAILEVLKDGQEKTSLVITDAVAEKLGCSPYSVYPDLRHLADVGKLASREGEPVPARGGRPRIYYRLAPARDTRADL